VGLGQSWSTPVVTRVNVTDKTQNADKLVLIFGGGYDVTQDNVGYNTDDVGNRIFMVDAINGNVLWHAGPTNVTGLGYDSTANFTHPKMANSIPADIRVIDMSGGRLRRPHVRIGYGRAHLALRHLERSRVRDQ
jgi:type IV pilus assembly protein PilY1